MVQASGNVAGLCNWAAAMCTYHEVAKVVEPKIVALRGAEAKLKVAMREKSAALDELAVVQGRLDEMQARWPACRLRRHEPGVVAWQRAVWQHMPCCLLPSLS